MHACTKKEGGYAPKCMVSYSQGGINKLSKL